MEYTVVGDTVIVAARQESIVRPGQSLMTETTFRHVEDELDCEPLGQKQLTGKEELVEVYMLMD